MADRVTDKAVIARSLLKSEGVKYVNNNGNYTFVIPAGVADSIEKAYGFSFDQLSVGGEIPLAELAVHVDEQAGLEARISLVCELAHHTLQLEKNAFELWYDRLYYKCKKSLLRDNSKSVTESYVSGYISTKYGSELEERKKKIADLEFQYRLLNNVFRSAAITKGELLPTLRNIVQGQGAAGIQFITKKKVKI